MTIGPVGKNGPKGGRPGTGKVGPGRGRNERAGAGADLDHAAGDFVQFVDAQFDLFHIPSPICRWSETIPASHDETDTPTVSRPP
jgi:hypothetical protein